MTEEDSEPSGEAAWLSNGCEMAAELQLVLVERRLETRDELAFEGTSYSPDRQEKVRCDKIQMGRSVA